MFQGLPRTLIAFGVVAIAVVEIATRLPDLMLLPQRIEAQIGEYGAKTLQPKVVTTQVEKTEADTRVAETQAQLNAVQQAKIAAETRVAQLQAEVTAAQVAKTQADTRLAQMQTALAATQAAKAEADAQFAQAQTAKTNMETAGQGLGLALTAGIIGAGVKLFGGAMSGSDTQQATQQVAQQQPAQQQPASPFETGRADWYKWHNWEAGLSGDKLAGVQFWADVRNRRPQPSCADGRGRYSAEFRNGCEVARNFLNVVDQGRLNAPEYRQGWNAGAKETGDF